MGKKKDTIKVFFVFTFRKNRHFLVGNRHFLVGDSHFLVGDSHFLVGKKKFEKTR